MQYRILDGEAKSVVRRRLRLQQDLQIFLKWFRDGKNEERIENEGWKVQVKVTGCNEKTSFIKTLPPSHEIKLSQS